MVPVSLHIEINDISVGGKDGPLLTYVQLGIYVFDIV